MSKFLFYKEQVIIDKAIFIGRVVSEPKVMRARTGELIGSFSLGTNRWWIKEERQQKLIHIIHISVQGKPAETVSENITEGCMLRVEGKVARRDIITSDGIKRGGTTVVANKITIVEQKLSKTRGRFQFLIPVIRIWKKLKKLMCPNRTQNNDGRKLLSKESSCYIKGHFGDWQKVTEIEALNYARYLFQSMQAAKSDKKRAELVNRYIKGIEFSLEELKSRPAAAKKNKTSEHTTPKKPKKNDNADKKVTFDQMTKEERYQYNQNCRHMTIARLYKEILFDMEICKIEGWDSMEYIRMIRKAVNGIAKRRESNE